MSYGAHKNLSRVDAAHGRLKFSHAGLARVLREHRSVTDETLADRLQGVVARLAPDQAAFSAFLNRGAVSIESGSADQVELSVAELATLSEVWSAPLTRLFASAPERESELFIAVGRGDYRALGSNEWPDVEGKPVEAEYRFPTSRLGAAHDVELGELILKAGGRSECHRHGGDEILIVKTGTVELELSDTDNRNKLTAGDVCHFYAEQRHIVRNEGADEARVMIVRHNSTAGEDPLRIRSLPDEFEKLKAPGFKRLTEELRSTLLFDQSQAGQNVQDRMGLAHLLTQVCNKKGGGNTLNSLAERSKELGFDKEPYRFNKQRLSRLQLGEVTLPRNHVCQLAAIYEIVPILLYEFVFRPYRNLIVLRGKHGLEMVNGAILQGLSDGAVYETPIRRLAAFGVSMSRVLLPYGAHISEHEHPGHELVIPVSGQFKIELAGGLGAKLSSRENAYAHFHSTRRHSLHNEDGEEAAFWVLRFF